MGGCADLVEEGTNGSLLEPDDTEGFEKALRGWLSDPQKLLDARLASRRLAKRFDLEQIVSDYEKLFLEIVTPPEE